MNKDKLINIRISYEDYQIMINDAILLGGYFKPNGGINISKYIRDRVFNGGVEIIQLDGMEHIIDLKYQVQKLGQNFNQLLNLIHTERKMNLMNDDKNDAVFKKYNNLQSQYSDFLTMHIDIWSWIVELEKEMDGYK